MRLGRFSLKKPSTSTVFNTGHDGRSRLRTLSFNFISRGRQTRHEGDSSRSLATFAQIPSEDTKTFKQEGEVQTPLREIKDTGLTARNTDETSEISSLGSPKKVGATAKVNDSIHEYKEIKPTIEGGGYTRPRQQLRKGKQLQAECPSLYMPLSRDRKENEYTTVDPSICKPPKK